MPDTGLRCCQAVQKANANDQLLPFGFTVNAELVWINRNDSTGTWNCGAALKPLDPAIARAWRVVVDALPESPSR